VRASAFVPLVWLLGHGTIGAVEPPTSPSSTPKRGELSEVPAAPANGFHFPYLLFIPESAAAKRYDYLLVEPNNTGKASDDAEVHRNAAISLARDNSVGNFVARKLGVPLLVPIFPRPSSTADTLYTHSLDRDTILVADGPLRRLDLQLLAMIADARPRLAGMGHRVNAKVLLNGFSASGLFANRFAFLHPREVAAAAYGGVNCFIMLPVAKLKTRPLDFPLGLADLEKWTGHPFDRAAYQTIPQLAYMGADDSNDAVKHDDAYSAEERSLIFTLVGEKMAERWQAVQAVYEGEKLPVQFKTYPGIGHGTDGKINTEVAEFFRSVIEKAKPRETN
jgi:hypothetical protein